MSCEIDLTNQLRQQGFRITPQRRVILHILLHAQRHLTPAQVYQQAHDSLPGLTEPTVYRTLEFLTNMGMAQTAVAVNGKRAYEIGNHHHHLVCRLCAKEIEIPHTKLAAVCADLEATTDFKLSQNHITFFGLCPNCQKDRSS
ncbi:MAG: transcriptional repressor [Anaerolineales bacterium]|nr:transcriptional repressor [Anaerolineales bacterium]